MGASAHAALTARGFAELVRFGTRLGGRFETLTGLSGLGDLILTSHSPQDRNMSLGYALGPGAIARGNSRRAQIRHRGRVLGPRRGGDAREALRRDADLRGREQTSSRAR